MSLSMWALVMGVASLHLILAGVGVVRWARRARETDLLHVPGSHTSDAGRSELRRPSRPRR